jgi:hypothetical protein
MSDNNNSSTAGYSGLPVRFADGVQETLDLDWDNGIIAAAVSTERGIGIHVTNPETGVVTPAIGLESIVLPPEAIATLRTMYKVQKQAIEQVAEMFDND